MNVTHLRAILKGSTAPALAETEDGALHVLKFSGAGTGPRGLLSEFVATRIAAAFGAPVPEVAPLFVRAGFPWQIGADEFDDTVQRSAGWNLGVRYIPDTRPATPEEVRAGDPAVLARIAAADSFLQNMDRSIVNPNILIGVEGALHAIDHDACLYFDRALSTRAPFAFALPPRHVLAGMTLVGSAPPPAFDLPALMSDAPEDWFRAAALDRKFVTEALCAYIAAFAA